MPKRHAKLPIPVKRALLKMGGDIGAARRRRRIQVRILAERASITRSTLHRVERGLSTVVIKAMKIFLGISSILAGEEEALVRLHHPREEIWSMT